VVVASGEVGYKKPDPRLFEIAQQHMNIAAREILHVGDRLEDAQGALAAGFSAALLVRGKEAVVANVPVIANLRELFSLLGTRSEKR
jgi:putative hydrolase of the HAD superfamily